MKALVISVALFGILVIAGAALWFASERHYDSCIREAEAKTPVVSEAVELSGDVDPSRRPGPDEKVEVVGEEDRQAAVDACSRWPF
jgi:hypothetical protein